MVTVNLQQRIAYKTYCSFALDQLTNLRPSTTWHACHGAMHPAAAAGDAACCIMLCIMARVNPNPQHVKERVYAPVESNIIPQCNA
jgi:hypothetical protein